MLLQWHVTERCGGNCTHCYQDSTPAGELDLPALKAVLGQFQRLLEARGEELGVALRGHINLSGGDPFIRTDFFDLLQAIAVHRRWTGFGILTNSTHLDAACVRRLTRLKPSFVQLSMDGAEATHDRIRGAGDFQRTADAARRLVRAGIPTLLSFTAHAENYREFPEVAKAACRLGVNRLWADRLVPHGRGAALQPLSTEQTREFFGLMKQARDEARGRWFCRTEITMHRALQFLVGGGRPYRCAAGRSLITVMPDGDLYPCRRMPVRIGNVMSTPLRALYYEDERMQALRDPQRVPAGCAACEHRTACAGGLRCLAWAQTGDACQGDPGCWLATPGGGRRGSKHREGIR